MTQRRWSCAGGHPGVLAPGRMPSDDIRRFCWPCSLVTGRLVARSCPAIQRAREAQQAARAAKDEREVALRTREESRALAATIKAQKRRRSLLPQHPPNQAEGIADINSEWVRLLGLELVRSALADLEKPAVVPLMIRRRDRCYTSGFAYHSGRVVLTLPRSCSWGQAATLMAHELAHVCCPIGEAHGSGWRRVFLAILAAGFGVSVDWPRTKTYRLAHQALEAIADAQHASFESGSGPR